MKKFAFILLSIILVLSLSSCSLETTPTEIEKDDFNDVKTLLAEQYELTLPDSADFIGGYFDNAFRDPGVIVFTIEQDDFEMMFSKNWVESGYTDEPNSFLVDSDVLESFSTDKKLDYQGAQFTFLWCDALENDTYKCVFHGHHPKEYF